LTRDLKKEESGGTSSTDNIKYNHSVILGAIGGLGNRIPFAGGAVDISARYGRNITYALNDSNNPSDSNSLEFLVG